MRHTPHRDLACYTRGALSMIFRSDARFGTMPMLLPPAPRRDPNTPPPLLVGREREWATLHDQIAAARAGQGSLILISGEAGIGKTALAEAMCDAVTEQGALVLVGRCYDLTETPPYGPWVELFGQYRPMDGSDPGSAPPLPAAFAQRGSIAAVASQAALFHQVRDFFLALAASRPEGARPVVLLLDDLHWSDPASLDLLRFLARSLAALPLLIVVTYRAHELGRRHPLYLLLPLLEREAPILRLALRPLSPTAIRSLLAASYGLSAPETERLVAYLHARAEGNAFFTMQLLRSLEDDDRIQSVAGSWIVGDLATARLPPALREVIDGRVMRFGDEAVALLEMAAVIGQEVPLGIWATASGVDAARVAAVVARARSAWLMEETPDGTRARFVHALVRDAISEGIAPSRRRLLHQQAGEALAALPNPDTDAVADHFQRAGDDRAVAWLIEAGYRAQQSFALITAAERYEAALHAMDACAARPAERGWLLYRLALALRYRATERAIDYLTAAERIASETGDRPLGCIVWLARGNCLILMNAIARGLVEVRAGVRMLDDFSPDEQRALRERGQINGVAEARATLAYDLALTGHLREAMEIAAAIEARDAAQPSQADRTWNPSADLSAARAIVAAFSAAFSTARQAFADARASYRMGGHTASFGYMSILELLLLYLPYRADHPEGRARLAVEGATVLDALSDAGIQISPRLANLAVWWLDGRWEEASAALTAMQEETPQHWSAPFIALITAWIAHARGDAANAWQQVDAVFPDGPATIPGSLILADALPMQRLAACLAWEAGDQPQAHAWLAAHDRWLAWSGALLGQADGLLAWAMFFRACGDSEQAVVRAERALVAATEPRQPLVLLGTHRLLGALASAAGRYETAAQHLDVSLALADACAAPYERALTLLALADLRVTTGEAEIARTLLTEVRAICEPLGAAPTLARAKALAARLAVPTGAAAPVISPAGLSHREVEVLTLLTAGRTNREIAVALFVSVHTVNAHVKTILGKTGSANRVAAAAFAHAHGLT